MSNLPEIEKDLARWPRRWWIFFILAILSLQLAAVFMGSVSLNARGRTEIAPHFSMNESMGVVKSGHWENPLLFAAANKDGFSGSAWMEGPKPNETDSEVSLPTRYLSFSDARQIFAIPTMTNPDISPSRYPIEGDRPEPPTQKRGNSLILEGSVAERGLIRPVQLPPQSHNDVLANSVVHVTVDDDGAVILARLLESSGSKNVDYDALTLARKARFAPKPKSEELRGQGAESGKLIFEWFALDFGSTNGVKR